MTGEVQQGQVVPAPVAVEVTDGLPDLLERLIDQRSDLEARDVGIPEHVGKRFRVMRGSGQLPQPGVLVVVCGDQQRQSASHG
ncbi:hypothetical protein R6M67_03895 [Streptomyces sp. Wh19]|nr:hypothetical protein [Streptomyces sp. Wh19]MDV9194548.1 hypothetical protein [Streptomyces sp. Wh19]